MMHLFLVNLLLILGGPFVVVGGIVALASLGNPGLVRPPTSPRPRPVARPRPRLVVAW